MSQLVDIHPGPGDTIRNRTREAAPASKNRGGMKSMPADGLAAFLESGTFGTFRFVGSFGAHIYHFAVIEKGLPLGERCNAVPPNSRFFALRDVEHPSSMASLSSATQNASKWKPGWLMPCWKPMSGRNRWHGKVQGSGQDHARNQKLENACALNLSNG
jgi:hypothetical protein